MGFRRLTLIVAVSALLSALGRSPAGAQGFGYQYQSPTYGASSAHEREWREREWREREIEKAFRIELDRSPTRAETRRYLELMEEEYWTVEDVRHDLRTRPDYKRNSWKPYQDPERVIRRAYEDILGRAPDQEGLRHYRILMIDHDWTERDVREDLRRSAEKDELTRRQQAEKIVHRAYRDILGRAPDAKGLSTYRDKVMEHGWDEHDVREALKRSPEYRQRYEISRQDAEKIVRRVYRSVLGREPDPEGRRTYVERVMRDRWTEQDVARELRSSEEYRNKHR